MNTPVNQENPTSEKPIISEEEILTELKEAYKTMKQSKETVEYKRTRHIVEQSILLKKTQK